MQGQDEILRPVGSAPEPKPGEDPYAVPGDVERIDDQAREVLVSGEVLAEWGVDGASLVELRQDRQQRRWVVVRFTATPAVLGPWSDPVLAEAVAVGLFERFRLSCGAGASPIAVRLR